MKIDTITYKRDWKCKRLKEYLKVKSLVSIESDPGTKIRSIFIFNLDKSHSADASILVFSAWIEQDMKK